VDKEQNSIFVQRELTTEGPDLIVYVSLLVNIPISQSNDGSFNFHECHSCRY